MMADDCTGRSTIDESTGLKPCEETRRGKRYRANGAVRRKLRLTTHLRLPETSNTSLLQHFAGNASIRLRLKWDIALLKIGNRAALSGKTLDELPRDSAHDTPAAEVEF